MKNMNELKKALIKEIVGINSEEDVVKYLLELVEEKLTEEIRGL